MNTETAAAYRYAEAAKAKIENKDYRAAIEMIEIAQCAGKCAMQHHDTLWNLEGENMDDAHFEDFCEAEAAYLQAMRLPALLSKAREGKEEPEEINNKIEEQQARLQKEELHFEREIEKVVHTKYDHAHGLKKELAALALEQDNNKESAEATLRAARHFIRNLEVLDEKQERLQKELGKTRELIWFLEETK